MLTYTAAFLLAAILAALGTPLVRIVALKLGAVSDAGGRNVNTKKVPRLGGVAIAVAATMPMAVLFVVHSEVARIVRTHSHLAAGLGAGATAMCLVGALDDLRGLRAVNKLLVQIACATLAFYCGFQINIISLPIIGVIDMGVFALPLTILWIVGVTNAVNLIDGLDGLAAGVVFCAAATNLIVAAVNGSAFVAVTMASLMGALFGFLFYNFNPAKIFMGDSGSYFLGFVVATASLAGSLKASAAVSLLVPVLALGLPIFDTLFSIVRRTLEKRPIFSPDRGHLHHLLLDIGLTHRRAVLTLYGLSIAFAASAVGVSLGRNWETGIALLMAVVLVAGLIRFVSTLGQRFQLVAAANWNARLSKAVPGIVLEMAACTSKEELHALLSRCSELLDVDSVELLDRENASSNPNDSSESETNDDKRLVLPANDNRGGLSFRLKNDDMGSASALALLQLLADVAVIVSNRTLVQSQDETD